MRQLGIVVMLTAVLFSAGPVAAGVSGKITTEVIEATVNQAAKRSGRTIESTVARKAAAVEVGRLAEAHGADVLRVVEDSGLEFLEAVPKYGDDLVKIAAKASPQARRVLALNVSELLPLTRRVGVEAVELEAKAPGQAANVFRIFGDDAGMTVARTVRIEDLPRIIKYGEMADSDATRKLLVEAYQKEGASLFRRIPPKLVLASGLTAAMIYGTHRVTESFDKVLSERPELVRQVLNHGQTVVGIVVGFMAVMLLWRFGLMPWHRRRTNAADISLTTSETFGASRGSQRF